MASPITVTGYARANLANVDCTTFYLKGIECGLGGSAFGGRMLESFGTITGEGAASDANDIEEALAWSAAEGKPVIGIQTYWLTRTLIVPANSHLLATPHARFVRKFGTETAGGNYLVQTPTFDGTDYPNVRIEGGTWGPEEYAERLVENVTVTFVNNGATGTISFAGAAAYQVGEIVLPYNVKGTANHAAPFTITAVVGNTLTVDSRVRENADPDDPDATIYPVDAVVEGMSVRVVPFGGGGFRIESSRGLIRGVNLVRHRGISFFVAGDYMEVSDNYSEDAILDGGGGIRVVDGHYFRGFHNNLGTSDDCYQFNVRAGGSVQFGEFAHCTARTNQGACVAFILGGKSIDAIPRDATLAHCRATSMIGLTGQVDDRRGFAVKFNAANAIRDVEDCWVSGIAIDHSQDNDEEIATVRVVSGRSGFKRCGVGDLSITDPVGTPLHIYQAEERHGVTPSEEVDFTLRNVTMSGPSRTEIGYDNSNNAGPAYETPPPFARVQGAGKLVLENIEADLGNGGAFIEIAKDYDGRGEWPTAPSAEQLVLRAISTTGLVAGVTEFDIGRRVGAVLTDGRVGLSNSSGGSAAVQTITGTSYQLHPTNDRQTLKTTSDDPVTIIITDSLRAGFECDVEQEGDGLVYFLHEDGSYPESLDSVALSVGPDARVHITVRTNTDGAMARAAISGDLAAGFDAVVAETMAVTATAGATISPTLAGQGLIARISDDDYAINTAAFRAAIIESKPGIIRWPMAGHSSLPAFHHDIDHGLKGIGTFAGETNMDPWDPAVQARMALDPSDPDYIALAPRDELITLETAVGIAAECGVNLMIVLDFRRAMLFRAVDGVLVDYKPPLGYAFDANGVAMNQAQIDATSREQHYKNELSRLLKDLDAAGADNFIVTTGENNIGWGPVFPWDPTTWYDGGGGAGEGGGDEDDGDDDPNRNEFIAEESVQYYQHMATVAATLGLTVRFGFSFPVGKSTKNNFPMPAGKITNKRTALNFHIDNLGPVTSLMVLKGDKYRRGVSTWLTEDAMQISAPTDSGQASLPEMKAWFEAYADGRGQGHLTAVIQEHMVFETMAGILDPTMEWASQMQAQAILEAGSAGMETIVGFPGYAADRSYPGFQPSRALFRQTGGVIVKATLHYMQKEISTVAALGPVDRVLSGVPADLFARCWKYTGGGAVFLINKQPVARSILVDFTGLTAGAIGTQYRQGLSETVTTGVGVVAGGDLIVTLEPYSFAVCRVTLT